MHNALLISCFLILFPGGLQTLSGQKPGNRIYLNVTDERKVISRNIGQGLLLRAVKESSVTHRHFGWRLEVVRSPYRRTARNLLYRNRAGHGADQSQVYAWHIAEGHFPNERELRVKGYPYTVRVALVDCRVEGKGADARFVSGEMRLTWERHR